MSTETVTVRVLKPISYDGNRRERDELVQMRKDDLQRYADNNLVVEFDSSASSTQADVSGSEDKKWPVDEMTPSEYLEKFPTGPYADLALELLALSDDEPEEESPTDEE